MRAEWGARIAAEYTSAAITQHLGLWLIQLAAPPELIDAALVIVNDELVHARLSSEVYSAAGGSAPPALDRERLGLARTREPLESDVRRAVVRVFCLGETVAVPLFSHLRARCDVTVARAALDRILVDEVRHRDFGWDVLDWLLAVDPAAAREVEHELPEMFGELAHSYGAGNAAVASDDGAMADSDRMWGLAPPREYAAILTRTIERDYRPRFSAREIKIPRDIAGELSSDAG